VGPLTRAFQSFVHVTFNNAPQQLADFGMQPPKVRTPLTVEQKAAAAAKMRATRSARGTTSRKQKLAVKGDVTSVTITPVKQPTVFSQPATPAGVASAVSASSGPTK